LWTILCQPYISAEKVKNSSNLIKMEMQIKNIQIEENEKQQKYVVPRCRKRRN